MDAKTVDRNNPERRVPVVQPFLLFNQKTGRWQCLSFPSRHTHKQLWQIRTAAKLIINWTAFVQNSSIRLFLPALNPGARLSSILMDILCGTLFFQNRTFLSTLKICLGRYPFSPVILLMTSGNSSLHKLVVQVMNEGKGSQSENRSIKLTYIT